MWNVQRFAPDMGLFCWNFSVFYAFEGYGKLKAMFLRIGLTYFQFSFWYLFSFWHPFFVLFLRTWVTKNFGARADIHPNYCFASLRKIIHSLSHHYHVFFIFSSCCDHFFRLNYRLSASFRAPCTGKYASHKHTRIAYEIERSDSPINSLSGTVKYTLHVRFTIHSPNSQMSPAPS